MTAGQSGLVYMGGAWTSAAFGDGRRLVAAGTSGVYRYPVRTSDASGVIVEGPDLVAHASQNFGTGGTPVVGATWFFQGWFRDPGGPCGSGFNLTPGLAVRFLP